LEFDVQVNGISLLASPVIISAAPSDSSFGPQQLPTPRHVPILHGPLFASAASLLSGWGGLQATAKETALWSSGERSLLAFVVDKPEDLELSVRLYPFTGPRMPAGKQTVRISCNGEQLGEVPEFDSGMRIERSIDRRLIHRGINIIRFDYGIVEPEVRFTPPHDPGFWPRPRAVAFREIMLQQSRRQ
jgi:hypothetical protein